MWPNDETRDVIGAEVLAKMKSTAILVNTGRGPVVNEEALCGDLKTGRLLGAGLDVFEVEPLRAESRLKKLSA